jgi:hypothetical protein
MADAAFVPVYSGGTAVDLHHLPFVSPTQETGTEQYSVVNCRHAGRSAKHGRRSVHCLGRNVKSASQIGRKLVDSELAENGRAWGFWRRGVNDVSLEGRSGDKKTGPRHLPTARPLLPLHSSNPPGKPFPRSRLRSERRGHVGRPAPATCYWVTHTKDNTQVE